MDVQTIIKAIANINSMSIGLIVLLVLFAFAFYKAQIAKDSFNLKEMFLDPDTKLLSLTRFSQFVALVISSWGFVHLVMENSLTEMYLSIYMGMYAVSGTASKFIAAYRNKGVDNTPDAGDNKG